MKCFHLYAKIVLAVCAAIIYTGICLANAEKPAKTPQQRNVAGTAPAPSTAQSRTISEPIAGIEFVPVPTGCFQMGDSFGDADEKPAHQICLDDFFIGKYEVTQRQWLRLTGERPSFFTSCGADCPVENVSWQDVQNFIAALNRLSGKNYRLPTEAEWEYACRSGGKPERFCGGTDVAVAAWYDRNSSSKPHPAGEKQPNGLGIYDMSGNVWEWVSDWYQKEYYGTPQVRNPEGPLTGNKRVMRGGSWYNDTKNVRAFIRGSDDPEHRSINLGFRLAYSNR